MHYYVFVDSNNDHFESYYNFTSNASEQQILDITESMKKENPAYNRMGSKVADLLEQLISSGYQCRLENNPRNRRYIGRIPIWCISGNY